MNTAYRYRMIARVVVEAATPLSVGSGERNVITDSLVAKDVNGLPYIPATTIAGVLRHAIGEETANEYFGNPQKGKQTGSKIIFTEAKLVDKDGKVVDGLRSIKRQDDFLQHYFNLPIRQHASLNDKGCVNDGGKFDEQIVYKGSRFCFEIEMLSVKEDDENFKKVLNVILSSDFKVGSGATCGFGSLKTVSCKTKSLDMDNDDDRDFYADKSSDLSEDWEGEDYPYKGSDDTPCKGIDGTPCKGSENTPEESGKEQKYTVYELRLTPDDFFLFGFGFGDDDADMTPVKELEVEWDDTGKNAEFSSYEMLIPATSVKGAIAHRVAYHYNKLNEYFVKDDRAKKGSENIAVRELFGFADNAGNGQKGNVEISDVFIKEELIKEKVVPHVAIDRFTGGTIDGALYQEKTVYGNSHTVALNIKCRNDEYSTKVCEALEEALKDICRGLLPLGGGVNRGNGTFTGTLTKNGEQIWPK